jgi:hypothetical protein
MRYFLILLILVFSPEQLLAEKISSSDFAAGYYLEVGPKGPVYSLELPEDVYRTVKSAELSDVRVFNGAGEVVPHEFRMVKTDPKTLRDKENIPFFPLYQTSASNEQAGFLFQVSRDSAGAIVNIKPDPEVNVLDTNPNTGMLQQAIKMESSSQMIGRAALGKRITLGGESALQSPTQPVPWKKWLLWIVLLLGVGLLAFMVRSLTKEIRTAEEKRVSEER